MAEEPSDRGSTTITNHLLVSVWHGVTGEATLAGTILDLHLHSPYRIELDAPSS